MLLPCADVLERISDALIALDPEWRCTYANAAAGKLLGRAPRSLIGRHVWSELPGADAGSVHRACERAMREQRAVVDERYVEEWDRWFEIRVHPSPEGVSILLTEVTGRKRRERALRESEERFRVALEALDEGVLITDLEDRILYVNQPTCEITGYAREELLGRIAYQVLLPPHERERMRGKNRERAKGKEGRYELQSLRKDGTPRWMEVYGAPLRDARGVVTGTVGVLADIARRREMEIALRQSEERLALALEGAEQGLWDWEVETGHVYFSPQWERMLGHEPGEVEPHARSWEERVHPEDLPAVMEVIQAHFRGETVLYETEHRMRCRDGGWKWILDRGKVTRRDPRGRPLRMIGTHTDISARKEAERALQESEERFREMAETIAAATFIFRGTRFLYVNAAAAAFTGYSREELLSMDFWEVVHPDDREMVRERGLARQRGEPVPPRYEFKIVHKSGEERWADFTGGVISYGGEVAALGTAFDVTDRKRAEAALRESEGRFRRLVENAPDAIVAHDLEGRFVAVNEAACRLWGYSRDELLSSVCASDLDPRCAPERLRALWPALRQGGTATEEAHTRDKDGASVPVEVRRVALDHDPHRPLVLGILRDIRERKQLEEQLWQAQKMEAVGRLAGGVAHDFNNLLQVIGGFASFLRGMVEEGEAVEYVTEIQKAADRAAALTRQLLAFGRRQVLQPKVLDLNAVVDSAGAMLKRLIPASIHIETELSRGLGEVRVDPTQLQQVLMNLVVNAKDAMPEGGVLAIETRNRTITERHRRALPFLKAGEYVSLTVRDSGCGMDEETLSHVFEPFFTTKPQGQGTGLGLSTIYGIVKQSGGFVWAESDPGEGSRFTVLLPRVPRGGQDESAAADPGWIPRGSGTILLAEDEDAVRALIRLTLEKAGYDVLPAANGEEALRIAQEHGRTIDLLLTDVVMPRMGGRELAERLRELHPGRPIVFMSGYAGDVLTDEGALPPGTDFVQKPVQPDRLAAALRAALQRVRR